MLMKLRLQSNSNEKEINHYECEMKLSDQKIQRLSMRTRVLQQRLAQAEIQRRQNEEYSKFVDDMMKPRKFNIKKSDLDYESFEGREDKEKHEDLQLETPLNNNNEACEIKLAVLNYSRKQAMIENNNLKIEISELESLKTMHEELWNQRKNYFKKITEELNEFRDEVLDIEE